MKELSVPPVNAIRWRAWLRSKPEHVVVVEHRMWVSARDLAMMALGAVDPGTVVVRREEIGGPVMLPAGFENWLDYAVSLLDDEGQRPARKELNRLREVAIERNEDVYVPAYERPLPPLVNPDLRRLARWLDIEAQFEVDGAVEAIYAVQSCRSTSESGQTFEDQAILYPVGSRVFLERGDAWQLATIIGYRVMTEEAMDRSVCTPRCCVCNGETAYEEKVKIRWFKDADGERYRSVCAACSETKLTFK